MFDFVEPEQPVSFERITAVAVIVWADNGHIVAVELQRGIDIPGGHVQLGETSVAAVAHREVVEEACVRIGAVLLVGYLKSAAGYIAIVTARLVELLPFTATDESRDRCIISPEVFVERYAAGNRALMSRLIDRARAVYSWEQR